MFGHFPNILNADIDRIARDEFLQEFGIGRNVRDDLNRSIAEMNLPTEFRTFFRVDVLNIHSDAERTSEREKR